MGAGDDAGGVDAASVDIVLEVASVGVVASAGTASGVWLLVARLFVVLMPEDDARVAGTV